MASSIVSKLASRSCRSSAATCRSTAWGARSWDATAFTTVACRPWSSTPTPTPSAVLADGILAEMVYDAARARTRFAVCRAGSVSYAESVLAQGQRLVPYSPHNDLLANGVVLFPSQADEYEREEALVHALQGFIRCYVDVRSLFESITAYGDNGSGDIYPPNVA